jgi:thiol-disulfide isomerase/thioredoxin
VLVMKVRFHQQKDETMPIADILDVCHFSLRTMAASTRPLPPLRFLRACLFLLVVMGYPTISSGSKSVELSEETFEELTAGKSVFIKFFAPWCSHSQELAPAWERLGKEFLVTKGGEHSSLISRVDCTKYEDWCIRLGINGFPTLLYGDPSHRGVFLEEYKSLAKSFDDLMAFAEDNLRKPICSPGNIEACDVETQEKLYQYWNMSPTELQSTILAQEEVTRQAEANFREEKKRMQQIYDEAAHNFELTSARLKRRVRLLKNLEEVI